jgi:nitric oxide reductase NorD protein
LAEAEEVITDVARHATIYARELWRRHGKADAGPPGKALLDVAQRLDLLLTAAFGASYPIRVAQAPAPRTFLAKLFKRSDAPCAQDAVPATDGISIWLPAHLCDLPGLPAADCYRILALRQAMRATRKSTVVLDGTCDRLQRALFIAIESSAADSFLIERLPGTSSALEALRAHALSMRPELVKFPSWHRPVEKTVRILMAGKPDFALPETPADSMKLSGKLASAILKEFPGMHKDGECLFKDLWTGDLLDFSARRDSAEEISDSGNAEHEQLRTRSARLSRRPEVRDPAEDEDDSSPGAWMVQTSQPHEQAEDPVGMQRPTDRDEQTAAEEYADSLSELPEARLVSTPGRPKEVLLSDDTPEMRRQRKRIVFASGTPQTLQYPEWDCRARVYRDPGATVHIAEAMQGPQEWVERTLNAHRSMSDMVRRQFETLRAERVRHRRQFDGEEIDLEAYVESYSDFKAGLPLAQAMYQRVVPAKRDLAVMLLIDVSGSTDAWVSSNKRIIDVEREALLLVSLAMQAMSAPYAVMSFSGEGPQGVMVRNVKSFSEAHSDEVARRIAALEPEHYTRAGAALRHATAELMRQGAMHRLLLLLSDGKPNDVDEYEGRYGVEDMRQAIMEAKLQGIHPFCLTIDRHAADYLPAVFGAHQYALLPKPELLPTVLLEWMKRLVSA